MYVQVETPTGATWIFQPSVVPPSLSEIEHEHEASERADDASPQSTIDARIASYPGGLRAIVQRVAPGISLVEGAILCDGAHGETDDKRTPPAIELPHDLALLPAPPSPGGRRVEETPSLQGVLDHEIGHAIETEFESMCQAIDPDFSLAWIYEHMNMEEATGCLSRYVAQDRHEWFAECLAAWLHPAYAGAGYKIAPALLAKFRAILGPRVARGDTVAEQKASKESVDYSEGMQGSKCELCKHFLAPASCALVDGEIDPQYWCELFERARLNELELARAISEGRISSPQQYQNLWLFAMRITGTGASYRPELNEHVWRDPAIYLNADFLDRCNGLPVIWEHPPGNELDQAEFEKRVIGSIMLPYIWQDEVWGIAKVYDQGAAKMMAGRQLSTSPAVVFLEPGLNTTRKLEGGKTLLIEGEPSLLDHLAVCELGVWDKSGTPTGIALGEPERAEGPSEALPPEVMRLDRISSALEALGLAVGRIREGP